MPPRVRRGSNSIALGIISLLTIALISLMFLMARPVYFKYAREILHPFDPHPDGVVRHAARDEVTSKDSFKTAGQTKASKLSPPPPSPSPPSPSPPVKAAVAVKAQETTAVAVVEAETDGGVTALDKQYIPTKEMVSKIAQDGYLIVTWANYHYFDFVKTWVAHIRQVGVTGYIVGAMDDQLLNELITRKINCFSMKSGLTLGDFGWGSKTFAKMGREKIRLISVFLKLDVTVIIADVDVVFLRNPLPFFQRYPSADMLTSSDHLHNSVSDESLENWREAASAANIGIMMFRSKSLSFVESWIEIIEKDATVWDQNAFNDLFRRGITLLPASEKNLFLAYNSTLRMGILPVSIFCSGHTYYVQRLAQRLGLDVYAVHATFQFSGTTGKRHRMREDMLWFDEPEYYTHPVGFLDFKMDGVDALLAGSGPATNSMKLDNVQGHFRLVNHQIVRVRNAMAIGQVLGRSVVMPQLQCGLDRWWAPHSGRIPGSQFPLPFQCPLDHVFEMEQGFLRDFSPSEATQKVDYREHSFFNNPRMDATVNSSRAVIVMCAPGDASCSDGSTPSPIKVVDGKPTIRVQSGLMSQPLTTALKEVAAYKVLEFSSMAAPFANFTDPDEWTRFFTRMKHSGSIWCCVAAHPGHIHYDLWWDLEPHTDKFARKWDVWEPTCGP